METTSPTDRPRLGHSDNEVKPIPRSIDVAQERANNGIPLVGVGGATGRARRVSEENGTGQAKRFAGTARPTFPSEFSNTPVNTSRKVPNCIKPPKD
jgi:hypothetical protein